MRVGQTGWDPFWPEKLAPPMTIYPGQEQENIINVHMIINLINAKNEEGAVAAHSEERHSIW
jgi:hypothetical protein